LALGAVADFGEQNCQNTTKVDARYNVQLTTSPAIAAKRLLAGRCFYALSFELLFSLNSKVIYNELEGQSVENSVVV